MSIVRELYVVTKNLFDLLQDNFDKEKREEVITKVQELLQQRDELIQELPSTPTDAEKVVGREIVIFNQTIDEKLQELYSEIQVDIKKLKVQKANNNKYVNPYESVNVDGMFLDKRK